MNWIDILWPMMAAASLTLALIHMFVWFKHRRQTDHILFALAATSVAAVGIFELLTMRTLVPSTYADLLRWAHVPNAIMIVCLVGFVRMRFKVGRPWLAAVVVATRLLLLFPDFLSGVNLNFREITALHRLPVWGGDLVSVPVGEPNPWMILGQINVALLLLFLIDAMASVWRTPSNIAQRTMLAICGSMLFFVMLSDIWAVAVVMGLVQAPIAISPAFVLVVVVMSYELGSDVLNATHLATSLKASELNLRESEQRMDMAVRAAGVGLWNRDIVHGEVWLSAIGLRMLGFVAGEKFDRERFYARVHPEDRERLQTSMTEAVEFGGELRNDFRILDGDGGIRWVAARGQVDFGADLAPLRLSGVLLDISERKQAEERFQLVVEAAPNAILMVDSDGRVALANHQAEIVFGRSRAELVGMNFEALVPRVAPSGEHAGPAGDAMTGMMGAGPELFARRKDGSEIPVEIAVNPIQTARGSAVLASIADITKRKRMEREAAQQRDELAHLSRVALLSEISGSLAHELNQPLTAILSNAQAAVRFLARTPPNLDEVSESLANIVESDKRAGEVIRRLRDMLRKSPADHTRLDVNDVVHDVLRIVRNDLLHRNVEIVLGLTPDLPAISGDRVQLQQVVLNLIVNGSDAMVENAEGRRLTLRTQMQAVGSNVEVTVMDLGRGIPELDIERIFSPFVTSKKDGMGLGLAVCTTIITAHRGRLWATNNAERGATVHFCVPTIDDAVSPESDRS
jgi:two-component system, LuxR family, sensor kinase FixL